MAISLKDNFGRIHNYLRISLTDKCNLRCNYCMPQDLSFMPDSNLLTADEIYTIAKLFVYRFGISKIRFTGGEPLVRNDTGKIIEEVSGLPAELAVTTNGIRLKEFLPIFKKTGLNSINVSMDTLQSERFEQITKRKGLELIRNNIDSALDNGFRVKINMVVIRGVNDDEVLDFVKLTIDRPLHVRFIEFMPFAGNSWQRSRVISYTEIKNEIENYFRLEMILNEPDSTSKSFKIKNARGTIGFISTVSQPFCETCSRIRLTADGKLQNCLFAGNDIDLLSSLRKGKDIESLIMSYIMEKAESQGGVPPYERVTDKAMITIGG